MLHHIGTVIPSSLGDFSKRITSATTAIAGQLSLAVEDISDALPASNSNNNNSTNPKEAAQEANTAFDPRVLELLSHARPGSSRPSSRLLKQSMLEYGSTPPRSAPLLVPGSPAFTRPWRVRCNTSGGDRSSTDQPRQGQGQEQDSTSTGFRPLYSASLASRTTVSFEDSLEDERSLRGSGRAAAERNKPGMMVRSQGPKQASTRTPLCSSCFPQLSREAPPLLALPATQKAEDLSKAGPSIPHHHLPQSSTLEASSATQEATGRSPPSSLFGLPDSLEQEDPPKDQSSAIGRNDQEEAKTGYSGERSAITPAKSSQRLTTAPPPISPMSPLPQTSTKSEPYTQQKSEGLRKLSEGHTEAANQHADGAADGAEGSCGGGGDGGSSTPSQGHRGYGEVRPPPAKRTSSTTARAAATTNMSLVVDPPLPSSHRPAIAEASRRPTIELDAALSRSSRLPPAPASVYTSSSTALSGRAPSSSIAAINSRGGSRSAGSVEAHQTPGRRSLLRDRRTDGAPASVNEIPDRRLLPGDFGTGAVSPTSVNEATITSGSLRALTRSGVSTTTNSSGVRGKGHRESSRKTHHRHHRTRRGTKKNNQKQQQQQQQRQQQRQAVASSSADPPKRNSAHSRGRSSSRQQANAEPEGGGARANNGAVTGAGWGGDDQMDIIAAAPKTQRPLFGENQSLVGGGGYVHLQRPDTREAFYSAPIEALEGFQPCVRCFDALMRHHKVNGRMDGEAIGEEVSRNFPETAGDPHVAFFVRWETLDKGLGRYIPQGFTGSFTPRPFRPALAEYAVKAASEDSKFWGLEWDQIPDTRCRVIVISSLEVAQHERDWLRNRHGLLLSFKDSAGRCYQSAIFPETMCKAGWSKEHTIDALFRKAGYWKPRGDCLGVPGASAPDSASMVTATTTSTAAGAATTRNSPTAITDAAVSRSAVFLRFQTVTHRMNFSKYQRAIKKREKT